jgi:hypothetical protein
MKAGEKTDLGTTLFDGVFCAVFFATDTTVFFMMVSFFYMTGWF